MSTEVKILVVDDDLVTRKNLSRILQREGYEVVLAASGSEGAKKFKKFPYDIVLVDLIMDDISGIDLLEIIKKETASTEVIIMTGYASVNTAIDAMQKGAFHYIQKPFRIEELKHVIAQAVEMPRR